jgi:hypothetical protein
MPLTGLELRGCWAAPMGQGADPGAGRAPQAPPPAPMSVPRQARGFVPVGEVRESAAGVTDPSANALRSSAPQAPVDPADAWDGRVSLFGDLER